MKTAALILASGSGRRVGAPLPKQFLEVLGRTVLEHTIEKFQEHGKVDEIIIVTHPDYIEKVKGIASRHGKVTKVLPGGKTRVQSSSIGVNAVTEKECKILIHDAARPNVSERIITEVIEKLDTTGAVNVAVPSTDTIIRIDSEGNIIEIPDRETILRVQTPQGFHLSIIKEAHELSKNDEISTDDCSMVFRHNLSPVAVVCGEETNLKVTWPQDLERLEILFSE